MAKGCTNNKYEEARKQRLEENKKRFEDLGISTISKNLTEIASSAKKSPHRTPKPKAKTNEVVEPRRSSRVRNLVPSYREDVGIELPPLRKRSRSSPSSWGSYIARPIDEIKEATHEERVRALEAAEALQSNLQSTNPSFVKSMVRSHVYSCFWLGLPSRFCEEHLPKTVHNMILEDENGSEYEAVYIGNRAGLSGGWRAFALEHKLDDGDALVFELVEKARFKVYIVRAFPDSTEEDEEQISEEEVGIKHATEAPKAGNNHESESNKTKKQKQAIVDETTELASSEDNVPESSIDNEVKSKEVSTRKRAKASQKKMPKKSKKEAQVEAEKPKAATKPKTQANKAKESEESIAQENGDSSKKNGIVKDAGSDVKEVEPVEEGSKSVSRRKKPAPKLFRKRA